MAETREHRAQRTLIVGAGLTGAALAYLSAETKNPTTLVSPERPATQTTALASGVVHGVGPPGEVYAWTQLTAEQHHIAAMRARRGFEVLEEVLLRTSRTVGLTPLPHELHPPASGDAIWLQKVVTLLEGGGWPTEVEARPTGPVLLRRRDAVLSARRLTFELLHQAHALGAVIQFGAPFRGVRAESATGVEVDLGDQVVVFERIFWAAGSPSRLLAGGATVRTRLVLRQVLGPGRSPLSSVLELGDAGLVLSPDPVRPGHTILVRTAGENPAGGLTWPEAPTEWDRWRGQAVRQRLAEAVFCRPEQPILRCGRLFGLCGLSGWPVSAVLGACCEALAASVSSSATS